MTKSKNLMEGLLFEIDRVKYIVSEYEAPELNGAGAFAAAVMKAELKRAEESISNNDVVEMLKAYNSLQEYEL